MPWEGELVRELFTKRWWLPALIVIVGGGFLVWWALSVAEPAPLAYPYTQ